MKPRVCVYDTSRHNAHRDHETALLASSSMRAKLSLFIIIMFVASILGGCLVRTKGHHHHRGKSTARRGNDCGPAYHWNGYKCVHNGRGKAKGHRK